MKKSVLAKMMTGCWDALLSSFAVLLNSWSVFYCCVDSRLYKSKETCAHAAFFLCHQIIWMLLCRKIWERVPGRKKDSDAAASCCMISRWYYMLSADLLLWSDVWSQDDGDSGFFIILVYCETGLKFMRFHWPFETSQLYSLVLLVSFMELSSLHLW